MAMTASQSLAMRLIKTEELLQDLEAKLKTYMEAGINGTSDWGYASSIGEVNEQLEEIIRFLD